MKTNLLNCLQQWIGDDNNLKLNKMSDLNKSYIILIVAFLEISGFFTNKLATIHVKVSLTNGVSNQYTHFYVWWKYNVSNIKISKEPIKSENFQ